MNLRLFFLIHNEKAYKRYYGQPLNTRFPWLGGIKYELHEFLKRYKTSIRLALDCKKNAQRFDDTMSIGSGRKPRLSIFYEHIAWCFKYKEPCLYYYLWGLDLKERSPKNYVAYTEFRVIRNILNIRQCENKRTKYTFNYLALTRDKFVFGQYAKSLGFPVPTTIALISEGKLSWVENAGAFIDIEEIMKKDISAFCKECTGEGGSGAFSLEIKDGVILINNERSSVGELKERTKGAKYIIQNRVRNHPVIANIYPNSVNTIRVVTVCKNNQIHLFDARLRTGANGSVVDNACFGGVVIGINNDGSLMNWGYQEPGKTNSSNLIVEESHPDTRARFAGVKIPYWEDIITMTKNFHSYYYGIPSMGWDVAITPEGPVYLECGEDWEMQGTQIFKGGRRKEFYDLHGYALEMKLRKY